MNGLTLEQKKHYDDHGWVVVPGLLSSEEMQRIHDMTRRIENEVQDCDGDFSRDGADYNFERVDGHKLESMSSDAEVRRGTLRKIQEPFASEPVFREVCTGEKVLDCAASILGDSIHYHSSKLMFKPAGGGRQKPWHQDFAYWSHMTAKQVTVWFAIDPATRENGCVQVWDKSHKKGLLQHHGSELQVSEESIPNEEIVFAEMAPGDVLFFDVLTFHASAPNHSSKSRLSCIVDLQDRHEANNPHCKIELPLREPNKKVS